MTASRNPLTHPLDIPLRRVETDIDQINSEAAFTGGAHRFENTAARKRSFDGETDACLQIFTSPADNLAACRDRRTVNILWIHPAGYRVGIEEILAAFVVELSDDAGFAGTIWSRDNSELGQGQAAFLPISLNTL
jgi:hypothetical protein